MPVHMDLQQQQLHSNVSEVNITGKKLWNNIKNETSSIIIPMIVCLVNRITNIDDRKTAVIRSLPLKNAKARLQPDKQAKPKRKRMFPSVNRVESKIRNPRKRSMKLIPIQMRPIFV